MEIESFITYLKSVNQAWLSSGKQLWPSHVNQGWHSVIIPEFNQVWAKPGLHAWPRVLQSFGPIMATTSGPVMATNAGPVMSTKHAIALSFQSSTKSGPSLVYMLGPEFYKAGPSLGLSWARCTFLYGRSPFPLRQNICGSQHAWLQRLTFFLKFDLMLPECPMTYLHPVLWVTSNKKV